MLWASHMWPLLVEVCPFYAHFLKCFNQGQCPHRLRGPEVMILESNTTWFMLYDSANRPSLLMDTNTHNSTAEIVSLSLSSEVIADLWTHYPELSQAILCSFLSWQGHCRDARTSLPLVCGRLFPPLLVVRHLMFFRLHLHVSRGLGSWTHT